ncbi:MAG: NAD(+)/NADH kinase [Caldicoprobacterales bacterium]|jgi:NAD+ kinase
MIRVGIVSNLTKDTTGEYTRRVVLGVLERNMQPLVTSPVYQLIKIGDVVDESELYEFSDLILVLGGDGTILQSSRKAAEFQKPILGINIGHLGFLAEAEMTNLSSILDALSSKSFDIDRRMMLEVQLKREGKIVNKSLALNDVNIYKGSYSRMIHLNLWIDGEFVNYYAADGLLISTPTGSTAYSLSAGGPIIYPGMECMLVTPVCPHTLTSRPIVADASSIIEVEGTNKSRNVIVTVDGQEAVPLQTGDRIIVFKSKFETQLIRIFGYSFYHLLRSKLSSRKE